MEKYTKKGKTYFCIVCGPDLVIAAHQNPSRAVYINIEPKDYKLIPKKSSHGPNDARRVILARLRHPAFRLSPYSVFYSLQPIHVRKY